jgi:hypothetical protein
MNNKTIKKKGGRVAQVIEHLPSKSKALSSIRVENIYLLISQIQLLLTEKKENKINP